MLLALAVDFVKFVLRAAGLPILRKRGFGRL
jgi:hypothetical protein